MNSTTFQQKIEELVIEKRINHLDAVVMFCQDNDIEFRDVKKLITSNLEGKIKLSAMDDGYLRRESVLPV
jgi:hypothetical protein